MGFVSNFFQYHIKMYAGLIHLSKIYLIGYLYISITYFCEKMIHIFQGQKTLILITYKLFVAYTLNIT